jgi:glucokinase
MDVVLGIDAGGSNTRVLVQEASSGREIDRRVVPTKGTNFTSSLSNMLDAARFITHNHTVVAVGAGVAGAVNECGEITGSSNLTGWIGKNYKYALAREFHAPATVINDCAAAALGEYTAFKRPLIYVIWDTGVGVAVITIVDGRVQVRACELGHMTIDLGSKLKCGCGGYGHLEALVGGGNIPQRFKTFFSRKGLRAEELSDRQWNDVLRDMAIGLDNLSSGDMGYPIVLGGGVAIKQAKRLPQLQEMVRRLKSTSPPPKLYLAEGGEDSGLIGAAYAAQQLVLAA